MTWQSKPLSDVCALVTDGSHFSPPSSIDGYPYITVRDIRSDKIDFTQCAHIDEKNFVELSRNGCAPRIGDVLFSKDGTVGKVALVDTIDDFVVLSSLAIVRPNTSIIDSSYLAYAMRSPDFVARAVGDKTGVAIRRIILKNLKRIPIHFPPLKEQKRIVAMLDEAFEGIARATANAEKNLANSGDLAKGWLSGALSPQAGEWSETKVSQLVDEGILDRPIDGNHGEIHPKKADFVDIGIPFIMASDLINGEVDQDGCSFITESQARSLRKGFARDGDVLISHKGTIGRVAILSTPLPFVILTPQVTYYRSLRPDVLDRKFLFFALQDFEFQNELAHIAGAGSTRAYIGITRQLDLTIKYPSMERQLQIVSQLEIISRDSRRLQDLYRARIAALSELKSSLLHKAFSGQLTSADTIAA